MRDGLDRLDLDIFLCSLEVFFDRSREVFVPVRDAYNSYHREIIEKNFDKTSIFYTICTTRHLSSVGRASVL